MTLMGPISAARSTEKASREGTPCGKDAYSDQRRRSRPNAAFAAVLAEALRR